ncbi:hypothetical protein ACER0C_011971 [Sarotherodon galilaeus]
MDMLSKNTQPVANGVALLFVYRCCARIKEEATTPEKENRELKKAGRHLAVSCHRCPASLPPTDALPRRGGSDCEDRAAQLNPPTPTPPPGSTHARALGLSSPPHIRSGLAHCYL